MFILPNVIIENYQFSGRLNLRPGSFGLKSFLNEL